MSKMERRRRRNRLTVFQYIKTGAKKGGNDLFAVPTETRTSSQGLKCC